LDQLETCLLLPSFISNGKSTLVRGSCPTYIFGRTRIWGEKCFLLCSCCHTPTRRGRLRAQAQAQARSRARARTPREGCAPRYQQHTSCVVCCCELIAPLNRALRGHLNLWDESSVKHYSYFALYESNNYLLH